MDKPSSDVAEDQRVVILTGLVANNPRIGAARRSELVLSNIGDPDWPAEEESLNGNDVNVLILLSPFTSAAVSRHPDRGVPRVRKCRCTAITSTVLMPAEPGGRAALVGVTV